MSRAFDGNALAKAAPHLHLLPILSRKLVKSIELLKKQGVAKLQNHTLRSPGFEKHASHHVLNGF
jgi:hypothetical protein